MLQSLRDNAAISEVIEMALSDSVSFETIEAVHGLKPSMNSAAAETSSVTSTYRAKSSAPKSAFSTAATGNVWVQYCAELRGGHAGALAMCG